MLARLLFLAVSLFSAVPAMAEPYQRTEFLHSLAASTEEEQQRAVDVLAAEYQELLHSFQSQIKEYLDWKKQHPRARYTNYEEKLKYLRALAALGVARPSQIDVLGLEDKNHLKRFSALVATALAWQVLAISYPQMHSSNSAYYAAGVAAGAIIAFSGFTYLTGELSALGEREEAFNEFPSHEKRMLKSIDWAFKALSTNVEKLELIEAHSKSETTRTYAALAKEQLIASISQAPLVPARPVFPAPYPVVPMTCANQLAVIFGSRTLFEGFVWMTFAAAAVAPFGYTPYWNDVATKWLNRVVPNATAPATPPPGAAPPVIQPRLRGN